MFISVYILWRILGESSLPGKALRTRVDIARLAERFNMRSQSRFISLLLSVYPLSISLPTVENSSN